MSRIKSVHGREILDSRGDPTVEVEVFLENGVQGRSAAPAGASKGKREAKELRDEDMSRYFGKGVQKAVSNVNEIISPELVSMDPVDQEAIDKKMIELDGTEDKSRLGANAIVAVSLAVANAAAADLRIPLYRHIGQLYGESNPRELPVPMVNVINGGVHARNNLHVQEFMIVPLGADNFREAIRSGSEVFYCLWEILGNPKNGHLATGVGDEGGLSLFLHSERASEFAEQPQKLINDALQLMVTAIKEAHYEPGRDVAIALDVAASELFKNSRYTLSAEAGVSMTSQDLIDYYVSLVEQYPIISIEDGMAQDDWDGWILLTQKLGDKIQLVGDDLFVTNTKILREGVERGVANSVLIKVNQVGTLTETLATIRVAKEIGYTTVISHRSGETGDITMSDIAVGCNAGQIKAGCITRGERTEKYNRLLRIEEKLADNAVFKGPQAFRQLKQC